jgi:hypothetical protein
MNKMINKINQKIFKNYNMIKIKIINMVKIFKSK